MTTTVAPTERMDPRRVDLHAHTTASDGRDTPAELVHQAIERNLVALGVTDHDSMAGVQEAQTAAQGSDLMVFAGVELNTDIPGREVHILGYFADTENPFLKENLVLLSGSREDRARQILAKLSRLGLPLEWERVTEKAAGAIGRPHIARALVEAGYVDTIGDAFDRYIGTDGPAYVEHLRLSPVQAVEFVVKAGGVPVLAHPTNVLDFVEPLVEAGLLGIEAYYPTHTPADTETLRHLANRYGLFVTGGTDHHGWPRFNGIQLGGLDIPLGVITHLQHACDETLARFRQHEQTTAPG